MSRELVPEAKGRISIGEPGKRESDTHFGTDTTETERTVGMQWRGLKECLAELVPELY